MTNEEKYLVITRNCDYISKGIEMTKNDLQTVITTLDDLLSENILKDKESAQVLRKNLTDCVIYLTKQASVQIEHIYPQPESMCEMPDFLSDTDKENWFFGKLFGVRFNNDVKCSTQKFAVRVNGDLITTLDLFQDGKWWTCGFTRKNGETMPSVYHDSFENAINWIIEFNDLPKSRLTKENIWIVADQPEDEDDI